MPHLYQKISHQHKPGRENAESLGPSSIWTADDCKLVLSSMATSVLCRLEAMGFMRLSLLMKDPGKRLHLLRTERAKARCCKNSERLSYLPERLLAQKACSSTANWPCLAVCTRQTGLFHDQLGLAVKQAFVNQHVSLIKTACLIEEPASTIADEKRLPVNGSE